MAIVEFTIVPIGTESTSLSCYVADLYKVLEQKTDIKFQMNSMSTTIEGPLHRLLEIVEELHEIPFQAGAKRVSTSIKIDDRRDKEGSSEQKLQSVKNQLAKSSIL